MVNDKCLSQLTDLVAKKLIEVAQLIGVGDHTVQRGVPLLRRAGGRVTDHNAWRPTRPAGVRLRMLRARWRTCCERKQQNERRKCILTMIKNSVWRCVPSLSSKAEAMLNSPSSGV